MYREQVRIADDQKALLGSNSDGLLSNISILTAVQKGNEVVEDLPLPRGSTSRDSHSRSTIDYEGPSDSPVPSPAENRRIGKVSGSGRTGSQPPRSTHVEVVVKTDSFSESSERNSSKPKIVYAVRDEVAFKRKNEEGGHDWIQGEVTRIIGEGKSRRYEVKDPFPDPPGRKERSTKQLQEAFQSSVNTPQILCLPNGAHTKT